LILAAWECYEKVSAREKSAMLDQYGDKFTHAADHARAGR
jgi:hypothetical protein